MSENLELFDTSNFEQTHPLYTKTNHRIVGKFESETGSLTPLEFVGLKAKMYSLLVSQNTKESKIRANGIKKVLCKKRKLDTINFSPFLKHSNQLRALSVPFSPQITSCGQSKLIKLALMLLMINDIFYRMALAPLHTTTT